MATVASGLGGVSVGVAPASADFSVSACTEEALNRSWFDVRTAPSTHLRARPLCRNGEPDPYGDMEFGIGVLDELWPASAPPGGELSGSSGLFAEVRFSAPLGTQIRTADLRRDVGHRYDAWTSYGRVDGVDLPTESCQPSIDEILCRQVGRVRLNDLAAKTIAYGARCSTPRLECDVGSTVHRAWALVLEARVTLEDLEAPVVSGVEAVGLSDGAWHRVGGAVFFSATDNTGVRERRVVSEGGAVLGSAGAPSAASGGCGDGTGLAYTYTEPCAGSRGINGRRAVSVSSPCGLGDGVHRVRGVAVDTGGGRSETPRASIRVDCSAPVVSVTAGGAAREAGSLLEPVVQGADSASGLASTVVEVSEDAGVWQPYDGALTVVDGRAYRFRARATDVAGNVSGWAYSSLVVGVPAEMAPDGDGPGSDPGFAAPPPTGPGEAAPRPVPSREPGPAAPLVEPVPPSPPVEQLRLAPLDPTLRILRVRAGRRWVTVSGSTASSYTGVLRVRAAARARSTAKGVVVRHARWSVTLRRPARGRLRIAVTAPADGDFGAAERTRTLR